MTVYEDLRYVWQLLEHAKDGSYELVNSTNQTAMNLIIKIINEHGLKPKSD